MDTLFNVINPFFDRNNWRMYKKDNTLCYSHPFTDRIADEFIITLLPKTNELEITVPLNDVLYKNKFINSTIAIDYIKMHLNYYHARV
jgi:hypothetical protein